MGNRAKERNSMEERELFCFYYISYHLPFMTNSDDGLLFHYIFRDREFPEGIGYDEYPLDSIN